MNKAKKQVVLIVLDGWGYREEKENNAISEAKTPVFDKLWNSYPHSLLKASGEAVGLPEGQMGNSEVGHITIGAGKPQDTDLVRISKEALDDQMKENPVFVELFDHVKKYESTLHLMGLIGPGGVHSHEGHLIGVIKAAKQHGIKNIAIHAFTDGRDTPPQSSAQFLKTIEDAMDDIGIGFIASASGRFYAMDRDQNWDRIKKAETAIFDAKCNKREKRKPSEVLKELYDHGTLDEHLEPIVFLDEKGKCYGVEKNDGILFFNFRADRSRQMCKKITDKKNELGLFFVTMTQYDPKIDSRVAYAPANIETTLANEISKAGLAQVHIAETEKFAHGTYYLNGGRQIPHEKEDQVLIESRKDVLTHDLAPEMKANEITAEAVKFINSKTPFIFLNFANPDMVGHTGNKPALIEAIEVVDRNLGAVVDETLKNDGVIFVTADHGNAEMNIDENNKPHTAHTINDVPAILIGDSRKMINGTLADIAPTILDLLDIKKPEQMTGKSLLVNP